MRVLILLLALVSCDPGAVTQFNQQSEVDSLRHDVEQLRRRIRHLGMCMETPDLQVQSWCARKFRLDEKVYPHE